MHHGTTNIYIVKRCVVVGDEERGDGSRKVIGLFSAPGTDAVFSLFPNAGKENTGNVQIAFGHGAVEMVVSIVQRVYNVLGCRELAVVFDFAPIVVVSFQYNLVGGVVF